MVKININMSNRWLYSILAVIIVILAGVAVWAYNPSGTGGIPSDMGHSVDEIDWSQPIPGDIQIGGSITLTGVSECIIFASTGQICSGT